MAQLGSAGALGALGRRFESCRPDSYSSRSQQYQKSVSLYPWNFPWIMRKKLEQIFNIEKIILSKGSFRKVLFF